MGGATCEPTRRTEWEAAYKYRRLLEIQKYRNIMRSYKEKLKTHCLAGTTQFIPKGMPVLNKINKIKDLLWTFKHKMKNT